MIFIHQLTNWKIKDHSLYSLWETGLFEANFCSDVGETRKIAGWHQVKPDEFIMADLAFNTDMNCRYVLGFSAG